MTVAQTSSSTRSPKNSDCCPPRRLFAFNSLRTLKLSCSFFSHSDPLFSIACALFDKNTGGGIPLAALYGSQVTDCGPRSSSCAKAQKHVSASPLFATSMRKTPLSNSFYRGAVLLHGHLCFDGVSPPDRLAFPARASRPLACCFRDRFPFFRVAITHRCGHIAGP